MRPTAISDRTVRALLALGDVDQQEAAQWLDVHTSQVTRRLQGRTRWTADELAVLADRLGLPISAFFMAPEEIIRMLGGTPPPEGTSITARYRSSAQSLAA
jgi:hypothetical protein